MKMSSQQQLKIHCRSIDQCFNWCVLASFGYKEALAFQWMCTP